jgi:tape measure domain-containing protein
MATDTRELKVVINLDDNVTGKMPNVTASIFKAELALEGLRAAANAVVFGFNKLADAGKWALGNAAALEQNRIAFETMLGSGEEAGKMLKSLSDFARKTPFDLPQVVEGSRRLLAYNIAGQDILPTFKMLGDIASGVGTEKLPQLILAFGQVKAATRLTGMELRQFSEAGVRLLKALSDQAGISSKEMVEKISAGEVSFQQVQEALAGMTSEGGIFFNLMEKQATTYSGTIQNLKDNFIRLGNTIMGITEQGEIVKGSFFEALINLAKGLLSAVDGLNARFGGAGGLGERLMAIVNVFVAEVKPAFDEMIAALQQMIIELGGAGLNWGELAKILIKDVALSIKLVFEVLTVLFKTIAANKDLIISIANAFIEVAKAVIKVKEAIESLGSKISSFDFERFNMAKQLGAMNELLWGPMPNKQHGGVIPGSFNQVVPALLHGGERVIPRTGVDVGGGSPSSVTVNFNGPVGVRSDDDLTMIVKMVQKAINKENSLVYQGAL